VAFVAIPIVVGDVSFLSQSTIVFWASFGRLYRVWISYPSVDFSKEKVLEL